jgi:6,7-dimethyl-8-ribityllumazine synthase
MAQERVEERQERSDEWPDEPRAEAATPAEVEAPPDEAEEQEPEEQEPEEQEAEEEAEEEPEEEAEEEPGAEAAPAPVEPEEELEEDELAAVEAEHAAGGLDIPDDVAVIEGEAKGGMRPVAIVVSKFNGEITGQLLDRALDELEELGIGPGVVTVMPVPGAFELPLAAMALAKTRRFACVVALGAVIRGETPHFDYVAGEAASGLQLAALETGVPVAFGVLTTDTVEQAEARIDKAAEAVRSALEMADAFTQLRASAAKAQ